MLKKKQKFHMKRNMLAVFRDSIVVSISACHADDPGSIPGRGTFLTSIK